MLDIWPLYRTYPIRDTMSSLHSLVNMHHLLSTPFAHLPLRTPNVLQCTMYGWPRPAPTRGSRHYFHSQCHNGYLKEKDLSICYPVDPSSTDGFAKIIGKWNRWDIIRDVAENKPEKFKLRRLGDMGLNPIEVNWYLGAPGSNPKPDFLIFFFAISFLVSINLQSSFYSL